MIVTPELIVKMALAMHEAFDGPEGLGNELNCYDCARWPDENTPDYHPEPGQICYDLAAAILAEMEKPSHEVPSASELVGVAGFPSPIPGPLRETKPSLFVPLSALRESEPLRSLEELVADARANLRRAPGNSELNHVKLSPEAYNAVIRDPAVLASPLYHLDPDLSSEVGLGRVLGVPVFVRSVRGAP